MTIEEKAREYALDALKEEIGKVEKAYIDGYNAGKNENKPVNIDGVEFYDCGLPSGTLWSKPLENKYHSLIQLPYVKAEQLSIPTKEDFEELKKYSQISIVQVKGIRGITHNVTTRFGVKIGLEDKDFWVKDAIENETKATACNGKIEFIKLFMGEEHAIILVKHPDKK